VTDDLGMGQQGSAGFGGWKKCSELKELGVSVAVFYSSRKVNGIQYFGDRRYTDVVEKHKDDILLNPAWYNDSDDEDDNTIQRQPKLLLPPLPCKLDCMNGITLRSAIAGLIKDLGLSWSSPKPCWWPSEFPYRHPKHAPQDYQGKHFFFKAHIALFGSSRIPEAYATAIVLHLFVIGLFVICNSSLSGNWSVGMRKIIQNCYAYYELDTEEYLQADPEDPRERTIQPSDLNSDAAMNQWQQEQGPTIQSPLPSTPQHWLERQEPTLTPLPPTPQHQQGNPLSQGNPSSQTTTPKIHQPTRKRPREPYNPISVLL